MVRLAGLEPATLGLEGRCSIQMSYKRRIDDTISKLKIWSGQRDLNPRPSAPKADALPGCAMPRIELHIILTLFSVVKHYLHFFAYFLLSRFKGKICDSINNIYAARI